MISTAATVFFLLLGQADGFATGDASIGSDLALIPTAYASLDACAEAGEAARMNNAGLSFLSYTCVPAAEQTSTVATDGATPLASARRAASQCDEVCELIAVAAIVEGVK